jgi:hypothetical protein
MRRLVISLLVLSIGFGLLVSAKKSYAQNDTTPSTTVSIFNSLAINLPDVSILPGTPLYRLKTIWENIQFFLAGSEEDKVNLLIEFSQSRLAEALILIKQNKPKLAEEAIQAYEQIAADLEQMVSDLAPNEVVTPYVHKVEAQENKYKLLQLVSGEYNISWER